MDLKGVTARIVWRYTWLQLVGLCAFILVLILLKNWINIPVWLLITIVCLWAAKDIILFPFIWHAYDWERASQFNPMIGLTGIVLDRLDPSGHVEVRGERWMAELVGSGMAAEKDSMIEVVGMNGLTLRVEPCRDKKDQEQT